jgi:MFS family permease
VRDVASPRVAAGLVFIASAAVLVVEILGIRLLAPYVGLTLEATTAIIGTVLAGIAAGAALGGWAADRLDPRALLPVMLATGGALTIATVPIVRLLGSALRGGGEAAALLIALNALFAPAAALSTVTPAVAKLQLRDLGATGSVIGRLSAWATTGALAGTFGAGFVIVPLLATDVAVFGLGAVLLGIALALNRGQAPWSRQTVALVAGAVSLGAAAVAVGAPCDAETEYHCARIVTDPHRPSGRTLMLEDLEHSYVDLDDPRRLEFAYARWIGDAIDGMAPRGAPLDAVFLGGAGFTLPRYLRATRPESRSRVLEVDRALVDLARERLGLRTGRDIRVRIGDARVTLADEPTASADLLVGDAFGARAVPWHLTTIEFAREIRRVLRPDGLYALNVIDQPPLDLVRAEAATLLDVFADVALVARETQGAPAGGNVVLLASETGLPTAVRSTARGARALDRRAVARFARGAAVMRDLDAPADQLISPRR